MLKQLGKRYTWEDINEIKGMTIKETEKWFRDHGETDIDYDEDMVEDEMYIGGYWSDDTILVSFEEIDTRKNYHVAKWFRPGAWD